MHRLGPLPSLVTLRMVDGIQNCLSTVENNRSDRPRVPRRAQEFAAEEWRRKWPGSRASSARRCDAVRWQSAPSFPLGQPSASLGEGSGERPAG